jgi:hypothetical protein
MLLSTPDYTIMYTGNSPPILSPVDPGGWQPTIPFPEIEGILITVIRPFGETG